MTALAPFLYGDPVRDAPPTPPTHRLGRSGPVAWLLAATVALIACAPLWHHHGHDDEHEHEGKPESHPTCVVCYAIHTSGLDLPAPSPLLFSTDSGPSAAIGERREAHLAEPRPISPRGPPSAAAA